MRYKAEDIEKLNNELDIVKVIGEYVDLKRAGASYKGVCPFHDEKTPSFNVSPSKSIYKCFGCNASGNAISFYMNYNNLDYISAVKELAEKYEVDINPIKGTHKYNDNLNEAVYKVLETAANIFAENLTSDKGLQAKEYLKSRGLDEEFIRKYKIGYAEDAWNKLSEKLLELGYNNEDMIRAGLLKDGEKGQYDTFRDRVMFPIYSARGKVIGFGGRILNDSKKIAKYLNSPETDVFTKGNNLYGLIERGTKIRRNDYAILMEGYMDVITAHSFGFDMAVATLGTSITEQQAKLLKRYTQNIIIAYDMDKAGRDAVRRAGFILKNHDFNIRVLELSGAKDPDEYLQKFGKESFVKELKKSKEFFDFYYSSLVKEIDISTIMGKKAIVEKFNEFFESLSNKIEYTLYMDKLSKNLDLDKSVLKMYIKPIKEKEKKVVKPEISYKQARRKFDPLELATVRIVLKNKKYYNKLQDIQLKDSLLAKMFEFVGENLEESNIEYSFLNNGEFLEYNQEDLIEILYGTETIENEEEFFSEIKLRWEQIKKQEREKEISRLLKEDRLNEEDRRALLYERVEIIKSLKRNF